MANTDPDASAAIAEAEDKTAGFVATRPLTALMIAILLGAVAAKILL